jgi:hypothetical protein
VAVLVFKFVFGIGIIKKRVYARHAELRGNVDGEVGMTILKAVVGLV